MGILVAKECLHLTSGHRCFSGSLSASLEEKSTFFKQILYLFGYFPKMTLSHSSYLHCGLQREFCFVRFCNTLTLSSTYVDYLPASTVQNICSHCLSIRSLIISYYLLQCDFVRSYSTSMRPHSMATSSHTRFPRLP